MNWLITKLIEFEEKDILPRRKSGYEYKYISNVPGMAEECYKWLNLRNAIDSRDIDPLNDEKKAEGWYPIKTWRHVSNSTSWSHWILERPLPRHV